MKFVDEYRTPTRRSGMPGSGKDHYKNLDDHGTVRRADHAIVRFGLDELLPGSITLVHGPGCPVCVTRSS